MAARAGAALPAAAFTACTASARARAGVHGVLQLVRARVDRRRQIPRRMRGGELAELCKPHLEIIAAEWRCRPLRPNPRVRSSRSSRLVPNFLRYLRSRPYPALAAFPALPPLVVAPLPDGGGESSSQP